MRSSTKSKQAKSGNETRQNGPDANDEEDAASYTILVA